MELATRLEPTAADRARWARYRESLAFWEGRQWPDRPRPGETRLTLNYARALVRKVTSVLFSRPVRYSVPASSAAEHALAQLPSEHVWRPGTRPLRYGARARAAAAGASRLSASDAAVNGHWRALGSGHT
ncbi:hypothetical protein HRbin27_01776 [bacterium HR27]|nr:hypothetical protein HRbin27_01776 [bacterium HR27]